MKTLKYLSFMLMLMVCSAGFTSCSDDDDDVDTSVITDYYMICTVSGGGLTSQEIDRLQSRLNDELTSSYWKGIKYNEVIYEFDSEVDSYKKGFMSGMPGITGTLQITFFLKAKDGKTVKTSTLNITKDGCTLS